MGSHLKSLFRIGRSYTHKRSLLPRGLESKDLALIYLKSDLTMDYVNSLVYSYLSDVGPKLAEKFKKETNAEPMPPGSPTIQKVIEHFKASPGSKRKAEKEASSSDDSSDEDIDVNKNSKPQVNGKLKVNGKAATPKKVESSSDDSSDEEEEEKPAVKTPAKATPAKTPAKKEESSSDDSSDEEEATKAA